MKVSVYIINSDVNLEELEIPEVPLNSLLFLEDDHIEVKTLSEDLPAFKNRSTSTRSVTVKFLRNNQAL